MSAVPKTRDIKYFPFQSCSYRFLFFLPSCWILSFQIMTLYPISLFMTPYCFFPLCCISLLSPLHVQLHLQKYHKLCHFPLLTQSSIIVGAFTHYWIKMLFYYSALSQVLKIEGKRLFLLLHMVDLDTGSLSSFISRTPTDFKGRSVHVGREEHWSQDPPMQI